MIEDMAINGKASVSFGRKIMLWVSFVDYNEECDYQQKKERLIQRLAKLKELIAENEKYFGENRCFFKPF